MIPSQSCIRELHKVSEFRALWNFVNAGRCYRAVTVQVIDPLNVPSCPCEGEQGQGWLWLLPSLGWGCLWAPAEGQSLAEDRASCCQHWWQGAGARLLAGSFPVFQRDGAAKKV